MTLRDAVVETMTPAERSAACMPTRLVTVARFGWLLLTLAAVGLFVAAIPALYGERTIPPEAVQSGLAQLELSTTYYAAYYAAAQVAFALVCLVVAVVIIRRRPDDGMAFFVSLLLVLLATTNHPNMVALVARYPAFSVPATFGVFLAFATSILFLFLFPDGRCVPYWARLPIGLGVASLLVAWFLPGTSLAVPSGLAGLLALLGYVTGACAQVYRYRRVSGPVQRQQARWVAFGVAGALASLLVLFMTSTLFPSLTQPGPLALAWDLVVSTIFNVAFLLFPLSIAVAILRYRLWDIDILLNRALVYATLTAIVVGLYIMVVGGVGAFLHTRSNWLPSLLAAALVAVLFAPLRERLQHGVNRLMYGERDDPYKVLSWLGQRLETTLASDEVLPIIVETVAQALKVPYAAVALADGDDFVVATSWGSPTGKSIALPLTYQGETIGQLLLAPRTPHEAFTPLDHRLLDDFTRQAGIAVHAATLTSALQRANASLQTARERLVNAREEERRRLRRDLHDGLGPALAAQSLKVGAIRKLLSRTPVAADALLVELGHDIEGTISDIRRLVYDLRPPALDELGLAAAIRERLAQSYRSGAADREGDRNRGLQVVVEVPHSLPPLPAAVEVAAYRIVQEALTNVVRHAQACACTIRLIYEGDVLKVEILDDGIGLPVEHQLGVGLLSMRERAAELGGTFVAEAMPTGGTRVLAWLPVSKEKPHG